MSLFRCWLTISVCSTCLFGCKAEPPNTPKKALPEQKVSLPEYFGFYAVENGTTTSLPPLEKRTSADITSAAEFLLFDQAADTKSAKAELQRYVFQPWELQMNPVPKWNEDYGVNEPRDPYDLSETPRGFLAQPDPPAIELLRKPVSGHTDMVRLIPASKLEPGYYMLTYGNQPSEMFGVRVERQKLDKEVEEARRHIRAVLADPLLPKWQLAHKLIDDLEKLRMAMDDVMRDHRLQRGAPVPPTLLAKWLKDSDDKRGLPLRDPLQNEYRDFVSGGFPTVSSATIEALRPLPIADELKILLWQPTSTGPRKSSFQGFHLVCRDCNRTFSLQMNLTFEIKQSRVLPFTKYISSAQCPNCRKTIIPEMGYLHGL